MHCIESEIEVFRLYEKINYIWKRFLFWLIYPAVIMYKNFCLLHIFAFLFYIKRT